MRSSNLIFCEFNYLPEIYLKEFYLFNPKVFIQYLAQTIPLFARLLWIVLLASLMVAMPADAQGSRLVLNVSTLATELTPWARIVKDSEKDKTVEQVLAAAVPLEPNGQEGVVSFGFSSAAYWLVVPLSNSENIPLERLLVFEPTWLDDIQVNLIDERGERQTVVGGDTLPFSQRSETNRSMNFNLVIQPGFSTLLIRVQTRDPFYVGVKLVERSRFSIDGGKQLFYFAFLYGALSSLMVFSFILFVPTRDLSYLAYSAFLLCFMMAHASYNGLIFPVLFADSPELSNWTISFFVYLYCLSGLIFATTYLDLKNKIPNAYKLIKGLLMVMGLSFLATGLLDGYRSHVISSILWIVIFSVTAFALGIATLKKGNQTAKYYLGASVAGLCGSSISALTVVGVLPYNFITFRAVDFGMLIDATMLSMALAQRMSNINRLERLRRFFSPAVANQLLSARSKDLYRPHQREIVVVFLDLRGYTSFTLKHDPEEVMRALAEFHKVMGELIASHGATLERFAGDGMMIFLNDPVEIPDPAVKACRMVMEMQSRFADLQKVWETRGYDLSLGVGVSQGVAIIGAIGFEGRRDYAAIGNVTNLAARLCSQTQGGQTIICSEVAKNIGKHLQIQPMASLILKGFTEPVPCYEMINPARLSLKSA